jgi:hypothetical protein
VLRERFAVALPKPPELFANRPLRENSDHALKGALRKIEEPVPMRQRGHDGMRGLLLRFRLFQQSKSVVCVYGD